VSQENVEIVRRFADCWESGDWDGMKELAHRDIEMHATVGGVEEGGVRRGTEEIQQDYEAAEETWDEHRIQVESLIDAGDQVVVFHREYQRGRSSGIELEIEAAVLVDLRDGRIVRMQGFMDREAALRAAGVPE
jgi:ketosteroid isomerase-like protein